MHPKQIDSASGQRLSGQGWWLLLAALAGLSCAAAPPLTATPLLPDYPPDVLSDDCMAWRQVQETLADLALQTMKSYGRLDPGVYASNPDGTFRPEDNARKRASAGDDGFDAALARLNKEPAARDGLARGLAAAAAVCAGDVCAPKVYSIQIQPLDTHIEGDHMFSWTVQDKELPKAEQWKAFFLVHASRPGLCPLPESIVPRTRASGWAHTSGLLNHERDNEADAVHKNPCSCPYDGMQRNGCTTCPGYYSARCNVL